MTARILVVDDDTALAEMIGIVLGAEGFETHFSYDGEAALDAFAELKPDLVLLDLMLPGLDGIAVCARIRETSGTPIIMLTARAEEEDRVRGLNTGSDDYIAKPFSTAELIARIQAVLRRVLPGGAEERIEVQGLEVDTASQRVTANGEAVKLGPTEYRLLNFFVSNPERVYTREQVLDRVWGQNVYVEERTVDVHIRRLRKALTPFGFADYIQTVRGTGYRFSTKV